MPRKRIAFVGVKGLPSKAGADRVVEALVTRLDRERFEPVVYCSAAVVPAGTQLPGVRLVRIHALPGKHLHATSLFLFAALHALFLGRYDLVHLHNVEASYVLPLLRLRFKVISTSHGPAQKREKWGAVARKLIQLMEWPYVRFSNAVTSVSLPLAEQYEDEYGRRVYFIPNGVDEAEAVDLDAAAALLDGIDV
ncbi:MAG: glycosyltransferase, partial [Caldilineaceae bacterium]|nr:glycosyltransferase [Caldilineaceae bacterium]